MPRGYKNERGYQKSHGHCKAHILAYLVKTEQIFPHERKEILSKYRKQDGSLSDFIQSLGLSLSEIHQFWAGRFYGHHADEYSVTLNPHEIAEYGELYRFKNS